MIRSLKCTHQGIPIDRHQFIIFHHLSSPLIAVRDGFKPLTPLMLGGHSLHIQTYDRLVIVPEM